MAKIPPGPRGEVLGKRNYEHLRADLFGFLATIAETYGDVAGFDLGQSPYVLVNGAPQVRELFLEREACLRKPAFVKDSNRGHWGDGLTTLEGSEWQARRRILRPSFSARPVSERLPVVRQCTEEMLDRWSDDTEIDLGRELRILTARIAARVVLDADVAGYGPAEGRAGVLPFEEAYGEDYAGPPGGDPAAPIVMVRPRAPRQMGVTLRLIDERIASAEARGDVLSDLVRARLPNGERLTRDQIAGEVIQMLYAGHLTIPSTLLHLWRDLVSSGTVTRVAAEADRVCASGLPEAASLTGSYCLAALKESMRVHPPAPLLYREVQHAFELGGFAFARDVSVWVCPQLLHHDARYFAEPHRFLPERFLHGRLPPAAEAVYLPFGTGPRTCIGNHQALHEMIVMTLRIARRFTMTQIGDGSTVFRAEARGGRSRGA